MRATRDTKKGKTVQLLKDGKLLQSSPLMKQKETSPLFGIDFCRTCGCALLPIHQIRESQTANMLPEFLSETTEAAKDGSLLHCSKKCENGADNLFPDKSCIKKFFSQIWANKRNKGVDDLALYMTASIYRKLLEGKFKTDIYDRCCGNDNNNYDMDDRVRECWAILRSDDITISDKLSNDSELLDASSFGAIYDSIRQNSMHEIEIMHPLAHYIEKSLLNLSDENLKTAFDLLSKLFPDIQSIRESDDTPTQEKVLRWRSAGRFAQLVSKSGTMDEELSSMLDQQTRSSIRSLQRKYFVYCPKIVTLHSCVPNVFVEGRVSHMGVSPVQIALVALQDIKEGQQLTISKIDDLSADLLGRQNQLKHIYGKNFVCSCIRCKCERRWEYRSMFKVHGRDSEIDSPDDDSFHWTEIKNMADLAMQHSTFKVAYELYTLGLKIEPNNGDMLHARCASVLERGLLKQAQEMWKQAYEKCPYHDGIMLHVKKQEAYNQGMQTIYKSNGKMSLTCDSFLTLIPSKCFLTHPQNPIFTSDECAKAVEWAESAAKSRVGGWTTSRHYAVPTTDIPIHEIPLLLDWFNRVLCDRLQPLLAMQFGEAEVGKDGAKILIHDAFIVRYDATGGQKYLPLHRDQSTHSLTIALNSNGEYDGGGTYISAIEKAVRPSKGGVLSFRGDQLLHGGDPVVQGRRYIIVAFCYICKSNDEYLNSPNPKKIKLDSIFHKTTSIESLPLSKPTGGNFSFGFQF
eukprot:scaffold1909_cov247-Chaetoceros_neogracile.AAC.2